ncbi:MAG TPA: fatty acid desaturase family protein [Candidatus Binatia bacterium]|nr:fatty acid desaturase family protein [Candidatus Binatia bacterium]
MPESTLMETPDLRRVIKTLSRVTPSRSVYHIGEVWFVIAAALYASVIFVPLSSGLFGGLVYVIAVAVIASRQHALMVLTHEGIHKRLSRAPWANDWLARLTAAFPVFISLAKWRFIHLYHHQYTHTLDDPDRAIYARYPLASEKFLRLLLRDACGLNVIATLQYFVDMPLVTPDFNRRFLGEARAAQYRQLADMRAFTLFWAVSLAGGWYVAGSKAALFFILYWLVPYCTWTQVFFRIRGAIEHGNVPDPSNPYRQTRTYFMHPVLGFFFSPKRVNYHLEHHLYPSVPFYYLPRLHMVLQQSVYPQEHGYCEGFAISLRKLIR